MSNLKAKLKKQGGFTMVELLIVVAIIGILAAVSIPMFNNALEKARHGVDAANIRSAISMANAEVAVTAKPDEYFGAAGKIYDYIVDNDDHQAELVLGTATSEPGGAAEIQCTNVQTADKQTLKVKIVYDDTVTTGTLKDKIKITANWSLDSGSGDASKEDHYKITKFS